MGNIKKNLSSLLFGLLVCFIILELFLRIYKPFPMRIKGYKITLPTNVKYVINNDKIPKLDKKIIHTKNSLGFRGEEPPQNFYIHLSIIAVGGSITECYYLSDDKTWVHLLGERLKKSYKNIWINNAGLDGHSTFGNLILLQDYLIKLKPKIILFLVGINDVGRDDLSEFDTFDFGASYSWKDFIKENSEIARLCVIIKRVLMTNNIEFSIRHKNLDTTLLKNITISNEIVEREIQKHKTKYIGHYKKRILKLIDISKKNGIEPIFITQPTLCANRIDDLTGIDLGTIEVSESINGGLMWEILELYNNTLKEAAKMTGVYVIDLANKLPKSLLYFYDWYHFTNEGAKKVSEIISLQLKKHLDEKYATFILEK